MSLQVPVSMLERAEDEVLKLRDQLKKAGEDFEREESHRKFLSEQLLETRKALTAAKADIKLLKQEVKDESNRKNYEFGRFTFAESKRIENAEQLDEAWTALGEEYRRLRAVGNLAFAIKSVFAEKNNKIAR